MALTTKAADYVLFASGASAPRFEVRKRLAARFGRISKLKRRLQTHDSSAIFGLEIPLRVGRSPLGTSNPPHEPGSRRDEMRFTSACGRRQRLSANANTTRRLPNCNVGPAPATSFPTHLPFARWAATADSSIAN